MFKRVKRFIFKVQLFFDTLLSDNHAVSLKRFVALAAFLLLAFVIVVGAFKTLTADNVNLLRDAIKYLSGIIGVGLLGVAATDVFPDIFKRKDD
jgi:hypothetical protein